MKTLTITQRIEAIPGRPNVAGYRYDINPLFDTSPDEVAQILFVSYLMAAQSFLDQHDHRDGCKPYAFHKAAYFHLRKIFKEVHGFEIGEMIT